MATSGAGNVSLAAWLALLVVCPTADVRSSSDDTVSCNKQACRSVCEERSVPPKTICKDAVTTDSVDALQGRVAPAFQTAGCCAAWRPAILPKKEPGPRLMPLAYSAPVVGKCAVQAPAA